MFPLPDGRKLWLFQDMFFSADNDLRDSLTFAAHNAGMVQQGECFTILGGRGRDLIGDAQTVDGRTWFWPLDGEIGVDGNLWIFMVEMNNPSGGGAGYGANRSFVPAGLRRGAQEGGNESDDDDDAYYADYSLVFKVVLVVCAVVSGAVISGGLGALLIRALAKTGALSAFAAGRDAR